MLWLLAKFSRLVLASTQANPAEVRRLSKAWPVSRIRHLCQLQLAVRAEFEKLLHPWRGFGVADQQSKRSPFVILPQWKFGITAVTNPTRMSFHVPRPDCSPPKVYNTERAR